VGIRTVKSVHTFSLLKNAYSFWINRRLSILGRWAVVESLDTVTKKFTLGLVAIIIWRDKYKER